VNVTRRDFVNGVLAGSGMALLSSSAPGSSRAAETEAAANAPSGSAFTGYGGVGDYRWSNGNTEAVLDAAHGIRDGRYATLPALPILETHDLVVVGGGFSGLSATYEYSKHRKPGQTCLLLENHPVMGGEAKENEFEVDGRRLVAPQGSNGCLVVKGATSYGGGRYATYADFWRELDLPDHFDLEPLAGGAEKYNLPNDHYDPMILERRFRAGYYFRGHGWVKDPIASRFETTPWPAKARKDLDDFANNRRDVVSAVADADRWLDSITYYELLDKLGYGPEVKQYVDPLIGVGNFGVCGDAISAFAAKRLTLPGTIPSQEANRFENIEITSFPGGNSAIARKLLSRILPDAIAGDGTFAAAAQGALNFEAFDRKGAGIGIRLGSTAVRVEHDGPPAAAGSVLVTYVKDGQLQRVRARAVVMASGGWVNRHIVPDLEESHAKAYRQFNYGPVLVANVAVRHWRFFDKLGFTVARWFEGLGWHLCVRRNVAFGKNASPLTPDQPLVLTFYIPFLHPGQAPSAQGALGRARLMATSYADFERQLREQLSEMFGSAGFDARRDIAGVILNRWGHAYLAPLPGFFFGRDGETPPSEVLRRPFGRILFAHSELQGNMNMAHAMLEGRRGALAALPLLS